MHSLSRRAFGQRLLAGGALLAAAPAARAVEPFDRPGKARMRLSLAAYSFRDDRRSNDGRNLFLPGMDMFKFLDFCAANDCPGAELTSYYFPPDADLAYLARVRRHAHVRGITVTGTAVGNDFGHPPGEERDRQIASVKEWIGKAAVLGAPHIRVFAGNAHRQPLEESKRHCIAALEECAEVAGRHGILLGIENHGGIVAEADHLIDIVRAVKSPWVGINLDTGNFHTANPYADLAKCALWAINVQFKGKVSAKGRKAEPADYARTFQILRDAHYQGWVVLEYELSEDPYAKVPQMLAEMRPHLG